MKFAKTALAAPLFSLAVALAAPAQAQDTKAATAEDAEAFIAAAEKDLFDYSLEASKDHSSER